MKNTNKNQLEVNLKRKINNAKNEVRTLSINNNLKPITDIQIEKQEIVNIFNPLFKKERVFANFGVSILYTIFISLCYILLFVVSIRFQCAKIHIIFYFLHLNRENPTQVRGNPHFYSKNMIYFAAENKRKWQNLLERNALNKNY